MLEKSLGILFYLKKPKDEKQVLWDIYLRIKVDSVPKELSTKRSWLPSRWNGKANRAIGTREDAKSLNEYLDVLQNKAYEARTFLVERGKVVTAMAIRDQLSGIEQRKRMLMVLFKEHNEAQKKLIGKGVAKGTSTNFNTTYKHTLAFLIKKFKVEDINILSLDLEFVKKMYNWLVIEKNLQRNSALKNITNLNKIVIECVDNGWLLADPFVKFETTRDEVETVYLTREELQAVAEKEIKNARLGKVRDLFIFCCFTGLSFIDVKQLKASEVTLDAKGELRIYKNRQKTGTPTVIPLLPIAKKILTKYKADPACLAKDALLPVLTNQKYNSYLKELASISNVHKELSSKMARNTFGTTVTLANNVPMETISKIMGHKSLRQTQHYAKVLAIKVSEYMDNLKKRLTKNRFISDLQI